MFFLRSHLSDGFVVDLDGEYHSEAHASRAADEYIRHYDDPCGMGVHPTHVDIVDKDAERESRDHWKRVEEEWGDDPMGAWHGMNA